MKCPKGSEKMLMMLFTLVSLLIPVVFPAGAWAAPGDGSLNICIIPHRSHLGNEQAYSLVADALEKATGYTTRWVGSRSYGDVIENLRNGKADIAYLGPFSYVEAHDSFGVRLIARTLNKKQREFYYSTIMTRRDSGIDSLDQLKGKSFAFTDPKSTSGFLFPMVGLKKAGLSIEDFSSVIYVKRHANSLLSVYNAHVDAGAVSSTAREKVDVDMDKLKVLWQSAPIYRGPWVARKDISDDAFIKIQNALLMLGRNKDADRIFKELGTNGFVRGKDSDYDNVRELIRLLPRSAD